MPRPARLRSLRRLLPLIAAVALLPSLDGEARAAAAPGVQAHLLWSGVDSAEVARQMDAARTAGARMLRVDVGWASLEDQGKGRWNAYHLARLDNVVAQAEARGLELLLTFWRSPCWASSAPADVKQDCAGSWWTRGVEVYTPTNPQDYADALAVVARRYGTRVAGWEIWNEPNATAYYKAPDPVRDYVALLRAAYPAAKAAAPSVPVVGGALMHADFDWTRAAYAAGAGGAFDGWSVHPYSDDRSPLAGAPSADWRKLSFAEGVPAVRQAMLDNGDDKPLWLTEFGWSTSTIRGDAAWRNGVDEATQGRFLAEAFAQVAHWPYVRAAIAFNVKDTGTDPGSRIHNFGLHRADLTPKLGVASFRAAASALDAGTAASAPAPAPAAHSQAAHSASAPTPASAPAPAPAPALLTGTASETTTRTANAATGRRATCARTVARRATRGRARTARAAAARTTRAGRTTARAAKRTRTACARTASARKRSASSRSSRTRAASTRTRAAA